jgi:hypothetical protein
LLRELGRQIVQWTVNSGTGPVRHMPASILFAGERYQRRSRNPALDRDALFDRAAALALSAMAVGECRRSFRCGQSWGSRQRRHATAIKPEARRLAGSSARKQPPQILATDRREVVDRGAAKFFGLAPVAGP